MSKICKNCGKEMPDEASFCFNCFTEYNVIDEEIEKLKTVIPPEDKSPVEEKTSDKFSFAKLPKKRIVTGVIAAAFIVTAILGAQREYVNTPVEEDDTYPGDNSFNNSSENSPDVGENADTTHKQNIFDKLPDSIRDIFDRNDDKKNTENTTQPNNRPSSPLPSAIRPTEIGSETTGKPKPPTTTPPTEASTEPPTSAAPSLERDKWEYLPDGEADATTIKITKYNGNSVHVVIPAQIDGKYVTRIAKNTITDNSKVTEITFEEDKGQPYLWVDGGAFFNLSSLVKINFSHTDLGILANFADDCFKLKTINIENWQYKFIDGALYYFGSKDWKLRYYCPGETNETLTIPSWCKGFENGCNLEDLIHLKTINIHKDATSISSEFSSTNKTLENINVEEGNPEATSSGGVLYYVKSSSSGAYLRTAYPMGNKNKTHTVPANGTFYIFGGDLINSNLETLYLPIGTGITANLPSLHKNFPNLKEIYIEEGNSNYQTVKDMFPGEVILY